jgi:nonribosomal peptide synthetase DhbF
VLGAGRIDRDDNFFDVGGNSLMLIQVCSLLGKALGREIAVVDLFAFPTVRKLGRHLGATEVAGAGDRRRDSQARARRQSQAYLGAVSPRRKRRLDE